MLQAVELKNTRAVEILLAMGCDPDHEMAMYNEYNTWYNTVANILDIGRCGEKPCLVHTLMSTWFVTQKMHI